MFEFFEKITPENAEKISETRADKIKASVLSRIDFDKSDKEETPMKKHIKIKPLIIAAAVATTGLTTLASANTVDGGAFVADEYYGASAESSVGVKLAENADKNASGKVFASVEPSVDVKLAENTDKNASGKIFASAEASIGVNVTDHTYENAWEEIGPLAELEDTRIRVCLTADGEFWERLASRIDEAPVYEEEIDGERVWKKVTILREDGSAYADYYVCDNKLWKLSLYGH